MKTEVHISTAPNALAKEVAKLRADKKLSLRGLAKKAKLTCQSVHRVEKGTGGFKASVAVMKALGIGSAQRVKLLQQFTEQRFA